MVLPCGARFFFRFPSGDSTPWEWQTGVLILHPEITEASDPLDWYMGRHPLFHVWRRRRFEKKKPTRKRTSKDSKERGVARLWFFRLSSRDSGYYASCRWGTGRSEAPARGVLRMVGEGRQRATEGVLKVDSLPDQCSVQNTRGLKA